jgi:hypothetical protein
MNLAYSKTNKYGQGSKSIIVTILQRLIQNTKGKQNKSLLLRTFCSFVNPAYPKRFKFLPNNPHKIVLVDPNPHALRHIFLFNSRTSPFCMCSINRVFTYLLNSRILCHGSTFEWLWTGFSLTKIVICIH